MKWIRPAIIPLLILAAISLYTVYLVLFEPVYIDGEPYEREFSYQLYAGFGLLLGATRLYQTESSYFKHSVLVLLLLWLVGVTNYLPVNWALTLGFGRAVISMQLGALLFLVAYYLLYRMRINKWLLSLIAVDSNSEKAKRASRQEIDRYKTTFRKYPVEKLQAIVAERKLVSYAVFAAQELLTERDTVIEK